MEIIDFSAPNIKREKGTPHRLFIRIYFCWSITQAEQQKVKNLMILKVDGIDFGLMGDCVFSQIIRVNSFCFNADQMYLKKRKTILIVIWACMCAGLKSYLKHWMYVHVQSNRIEWNWQLRKFDLTIRTQK